MANSEYNYCIVAATHFFVIWIAIDSTSESEAEAVESDVCLVTNHMISKQSYYFCRDSSLLLGLARGKALSGLTLYSVLLTIELKHV